MKDIYTIELPTAVRVINNQYTDIIKCLADCYKIFKRKHFKVIIIKKNGIVFKKLIDPKYKETDKILSGIKDYFILNDEGQQKFFFKP